MPTHTVVAPQKNKEGLQPRSRLKTVQPNVPKMHYYYGLSRTRRPFCWAGERGRPARIHLPVRPSLILQPLARLIYVRPTYTMDLLSAVTDSELFA